ncbi:hypothetical protein [Runella sp. SP2]|uniref:hypothetical protein n=1 Tax=Runella sp. SP2 TaxID=2268026 RepID=UPI000F07B748|nr:hypothetical protein [Runella sp. SP2]AYQ33684.1 hypothetical protein DTQ70_16650 [Runella sp. SP2]
MKKAFIDTNFLIKLLNIQDPAHKNAVAYFKYFVENQIIIIVSSIAVGEYCVQGEITHLPLKNLQTLNYNILHAIKAGKCGFIAFNARKNKEITVERIVITNDVKLFAQAEIEKVTFYVTGDTKSKSIFDLLRKEAGLSYQFIDINKPLQESFGVLF